MKRAALMLADQKGREIALNTDILKRRAGMTILAAAMCALAAPTIAQTPAPAPAAAPAPHIRGKIASMTADSVVVQPKRGKPVAIKLTPAWGVTVLKAVDVSAIQTGSFIGTTTVEHEGRPGRSLEVHVFPPGVKMGQGHYPWDLKPHSMMTNGDVGKVAAGAKGRTIEVSYPGGMHTILVPANVPVVQITLGTRAMVKPGMQVFIIPAKGADGTFIADRIAIGENGAAPPM